MSVLHGVGVGPGDPDLITLKAARLIEAADVVAYPQADDEPSMARRIAAAHLGRQREEPICVPMRGERHPAARVYDEAAARLGAHLDVGRSVVVLCEGDPLFYGSFMYLHARMAGRWDVRVVPGVSSVMAAASAVGRPLAARDDALTVIPGTLPDAEIERHLTGSDAAAIIKLGRHLPRVSALLDRLGLAPGTAYCERVGLPAQRLAMLPDLEGPAPYFSLLLVYRGAEAWVADLPAPETGARA